MEYGTSILPCSCIVTVFGDLANQMPDKLPIDEFLDYWGVGGGDMSLFENYPRKWPNSHSQKLFLSLFEKWQNSILSRCSAITSTSKYTTHYTFKC